MAGKRTVDIFGTKFILVRGPPWTYKRPKFPILKRYNLPAPMNPNTPLGKQQIKFAQVATSSAVYGQTGKIVYKGISMPRVAYLIARGVAGSTGGKSREQRRTERHEAALARLAAVQGASYSYRGGYGGGTAPAPASATYPGYPGY